MLDFVTKLTETPYLINEDDRKKLSSVGFTQNEIWDISEIAGFFNMSNRIASAVDMMPNEEYHYESRSKK